MVEIPAAIFALLSRSIWLIGVLFWVFCLVDTLRRQREYVWIILLILPLTAPLAVLVYLLNFYALEWAGWRRLDVIWKDRSRMRQLEQDLQATEIPGHRQELAQIYYRQGRFVDCVRTLKKALDDDPENLRGQFTAGAALVEIGKPAEAIPHLEYVVGEDPQYDFGEGPMTLAVAYENAGRVVEAVAAYRRVLQKYRRADAVVRKANLLMGRGETEEARRDLEQLLRESSAAPGFGRRAERLWLGRARLLLRRLS